MTLNPDKPMTLEITPWECAISARGIALVIAESQEELDLSEIESLVKLLQRFRIAATA